MGIETAFIFNDVQLVDNCLDALREAAIEALEEDDGGWTRILRYLYVDCTDGPIIDLQIDKKLTKEIKKDFKSLATPLGKLSKIAPQEDDENERRYLLKFIPYDGWWFEWEGTDDFAEWVGPFCLRGQIFEYTEDDGGRLWGWEFNQGKVRNLELKPVGRWRKPETGAI